MSGRSIGTPSQEEADPPDVNESTPRVGAKRERERERNVGRLCVCGAMCEVREENTELKNNVDGNLKGGEAFCVPSPFP